jgi:hypothetical protein
MVFPLSADGGGTATEAAAAVVANSGNKWMESIDLPETHTVFRLLGFLGQPKGRLP